MVDGRRPELTDAPPPPDFEVSAVNELGESVSTVIATEHRLTIYLDKRELATLTTLGAAPAHLVIGHLVNQGVVASCSEIAAIQIDLASGIALATSRSRTERGIPIWEEPKSDRAIAPSTLSTTAPPLTEEALFGVLERVRERESTSRIGSAFHTCALCSNAGIDRGDLLRSIDDVDPRNAVDAIAGWMWMEDVPGDDKLLYASSPLTWELVNRCARMGIPYLASRSAPTELAIRIARRLGITLIGRCSGTRYLLFTGDDRFVRLPVTALA